MTARLTCKSRDSMPESNEWINKAMRTPSVFTADVVAPADFVDDSACAADPIQPGPSTATSARNGSRDMKHEHALSTSSLALCVKPGFVRLSVGWFRCLRSTPVMPSSSFD